MFKQAFSFAQTAEDKSIRLRVAPQLYAVTRASKLICDTLWSKSALCAKQALLQSGVISARFSSICNRKNLSCDPVTGTTTFLLFESYKN